MACGTGSYSSNDERLGHNAAVHAVVSNSLMDGNILDICQNAIHAGSTDPNPEK
jgi:hypothetical protein